MATLNISTALKHGIYRDYKGVYWCVMGTGSNTDTGELMVIYNDRDGKIGMRVTPIDTFNEKTLHNGKMVKRFTKVRRKGEISQV